MAPKRSNWKLVSVNITPLVRKKIVNNKYFSYLSFNMNKARVFIILLVIWLVLSSLFVTVAVWNSRVGRAVLSMAWGLVILWIFVCGSLMYFNRDKIKAVVLKIPLGWRTKFVLFCILLALIEEAITTTMTNIAPFFGVNIGEAYITASTNYLDVVLLHSVIVFIPAFIIWAFLLGRYNFTPFQVFLTYGISGLLGEISAFGLQHLSEFSLWTLVYGLMIYLPAYSLPVRKNLRPVRWWHFVLAILLPIPFSIPIAAFIFFFLKHAGNHFPPINI